MSEQAWREGELLFNGQEPRGALTRYDYAAFHAVCALLLTEGLEFWPDFSNCAKMRTTIVRW